MINFFKKYYFLIIPLIVTAYMLVQGIPLTVNDDRFIMEMAKSFQTNAHSEYLMFVSIIQGYILKFLYNLVPSVNWFAVLYLFTINITFALFYKIIQNYNNKLIFVGITTLTQIAAMSLITFTMMPFICSTAAVLWGLEYIKEINKSSIKHFILVFFMFFLGFSIRSSSPFVCIFLVFLPVYFFAVKERRNSIWVVALLLSFCTIANYTNIWAKDAYKKTFSYEMYYNQFHEYRSMVSDTTAIDYEENKEELDKIGITENDLKVYASWKYADKNVFSAENLKKISELQTFSNKYMLDISDFSVSRSIAIILFALFAAALLCFIYFKDRRKEVLLFSVFLFGAISYLFFRKRAPFRIVFIINILGIMTYLYIAMQELNDKVQVGRILKRLTYIMFVVIFIGLNISNIKKVNFYKENALDAQIVGEYINSNQDKTYVTDERGRWYLAPALLSLCTNETHVPPANIFGDWYIYTHFWYDRLDQLGLSEYKDCTFKAVLDEDVRVVCRDERYMTDLISTFLYEHYDIPVEYEIEDTIPGTDYRVYKFTANY